MFDEITSQTLSVVMLGLVCIELFIITLSYYIAFLIKKSFSIGAILGYFIISTVIYLSLFTNLTYTYLKKENFWTNCAVFFLVLSILRFISGLVLLISIWKQNKKEN